MIVVILVFDIHTAHLPGVEAPMPSNFWMIVSNPENFAITRNMGFTVQGLKAQHKRKIQRIEKGDRILFYVSGDRRFAATATTKSSCFEDEEVVWRNEGEAGWPYRVRIKPDVVLDEEQYIDANLLAPRLDYVKRWPPENWYMAFQGNLHLIPKSDFLLIEEEMKKLKYGPDYRPTLPDMVEGPKRRKGRRQQGPVRASA